MPSDGRIIAAEVLSGPNPSPISITIFKQLAQPGAGSACCFFVSDTGPFQLTPNAVTTLPLNIPVERNTKEGVLGVDLVSVSAENDGGSLPLREAGPHNVLSIPDGNPMAGAFYPRLGRIPNDSQGGRHEIQEGVPASNCWSAGPSARPATRPARPAPRPAPDRRAALGSDRRRPRGAPRLAGNQAAVEGGKALVNLVCGGDAACEGKLSLLGSTATRLGRRQEAEAGRLRQRVLQARRRRQGHRESEPERQGQEAPAQPRQGDGDPAPGPKGGAATTAKLTLARTSSPGRSSRASPPPPAHTS